MRVQLNQMAAEHHETRRMAMEDALTGLGNRRSLDIALGELSEDPHRTVSLIFIDLDNFKGINDTFSHQVGDQVLQQVGRLLLAASRANDSVIRFGGDEFVLLLPDTTCEQAQAMAERLRLLVAAHPWVPADPRLRVRLSIGVAEHQAGAAYDEMLTAADLAAYVSKRAGRDRVSIAG